MRDHPSFNLDEALIRKHHRERSTRMRRRLRFRLNSLLLFGVSTAIVFAILIDGSWALAELANLSIDDWKAGLEGRTLTQIMAIPTLLSALLLGGVAVGCYVMKWRHRGP